MNRDERMIRLAARMAEKSQHRFQRVGVIIAKGNRIIGVGINKYRTHPQQINWHTEKNSNSIHAELDGVISSGDIRGTTIYVVRVLKSGECSMAKPCRECQKIIESAGIKRVVYTTWDGVESYYV